MTTFTEESTRHRVTTLLRKKSDTFEAFEAYLAWFETSTGVKLKILHVDGGSEFLARLKALCIAKGIEIETTAPDSPESNGLAERTFRTIPERMRAILSDGGMPAFLWGEAACCATHTVNFLPTAALDGVTPSEAFFKRTPDVSHLRVFGCNVYARILGAQGNKMQNGGLFFRLRIQVLRPSNTANHKVKRCRV